MRGVPVWDAAVRIAHWTVAALVIADLVLDDGGPLHRNLGYVAAGAIVLRLLWAAFARGHASLRELRPSVRESLAYVHARAPRPLGHDPLGKWMVWLLWLSVLLLALTGWVSRLDAFWGDDGIRDLHAAIATVLQVAVLVHIASVVAMSLYWRHNLVLSMITGRKKP